MKLNFDLQMFNGSTKSTFNLDISGAGDSVTIKNGSSNKLWENLGYNGTFNGSDDGQDVFGTYTFGRSGNQLAWINSLGSGLSYAGTDAWTYTGTSIDGVNEAFSVWTANTGLTVTLGANSVADFGSNINGEIRGIGITSNSFTNYTIDAETLNGLMLGTNENQTVSGLNVTLSSFANDGFFVGGDFDGQTLNFNNGTNRTVVLNQELEDTADDFVVKNNKAQANFVSYSDGSDDDVNGWVRLVNVNRSSALNFVATGVSETGSDSFTMDFGTGTDSVNVYAINLTEDEGDDSFNTSLEDKAKVNYNVINGRLNVTDAGANATANITLGNTYSLGDAGLGEEINNVLTLADVDEKAKINIIATNVSNGDVSDQITFSGVGVESLTVGANGVDVVANNWVGYDYTAGKEGNVLNIGSVDLTNYEATVNNNTLTLNATNASGEQTHLEINLGENTGSKGAGITLNKSGKNLQALFLNGKGFSNETEDKAYGLNDVDVIVGNAAEDRTLNLGDTTLKTKITLGGDEVKQSQGKADFTGDKTFYLDVTTVIGSSAVGNMIIGDMGDKSIEIQGMAQNDSLYAGGSTTDNTISSAAHKRAYIGTSASSGITHIVMTKGGADTNNFGFVEGWSGVIEDEENADVISLMRNGGDYINVEEDNNGRINYAFGESASNNIVFDGLRKGEYTLLFNDNMDPDTAHKVKIDAGQGYVTFDEDVVWYLGQVGNGTTEIRLTENDSNVDVNHGTNALMGITEINGQAGGDGNWLNGLTNVAMTVSASDTGATTICGGQTNNRDTGNDTLTGGATGATTFIVGSRMGADVLNNIKSGDTIEFLTGKYSDLVGFNTGSSATTLIADFGYNTITGNLANGKTMGDLDSLTVKFDETGATYKWNGSAWKPAN